MPANSFAVPLNAQGSSLMLTSDSKYGFRYTEDAVALSLIRASYNPDPYPEYGKQHFRLGVGVCADAAPAALYRMAARFAHPICYCTADLHDREGSLPLDGRFLQVTGDVQITAVKTAENGRDVVVRLHDRSGEGSAFSLTLARGVRAAHATDLNETPLQPLAVRNGAACGECAPFAIQTVLLELA